MNVGNQNKKGSMFYLSKEATSKDTQFKTQAIVSLNNDQPQGSEKIWRESGFFGDQRTELTILKANFPESYMSREVK